MYYYNVKEKVMTIPTIGYNSDLFKYKKKDFIFWDVGATHFRNWPGFVEGANFIFFVLDSSDIHSIKAGKDLLYQIYFGKRFRNFVKMYKLKEKNKTSYELDDEEEEEDTSALDGRDYLNILEEESDYEMIENNKKKNLNVNFNFLYHKILL